MSGGGCRRGMSVSSGGGRSSRSAGAACAVVKHVVLAVVAMEFRNFFLFFCRFAMLYIDVCTVFCKKKKNMWTCMHDI